LSFQPEREKLFHFTIISIGYLDKTIVFLFQVGKLKFIACNLMGNFEWNKVKNQDKKDNLKKSFQPSNSQ